MTFRIWTLFVLFFLLKNRALASESPPDPAPPALVGDNLTRSPANGIVDEDQIIQCFLNEEIPDKGQLISECPFDAKIFSKIPPKNLIDFCPGRFYTLGTCDLFWLF